VGRAEASFHLNASETTRGARRSAQVIAMVRRVGSGAKPLVLRWEGLGFDRITSPITGERNMRPAVAKGARSCGG
jgi:hypothetical protein